MKPLDLPILLATPGYWYMASPYSRYSCGLYAAYVQASAAAGWLIKQGVAVFCPISHSHPIAKYGDIDPCSHEIWLPADRPLMQAACGLVVCQLEGWDTSYGVRYEIEYFQNSGKPVYAMAWPQGEAT